MELTVYNELSRYISNNYRHAANGLLAWKSEKAFFEAQVKKNYKIMRAINNNELATIESLKLAVRECASMGLSMSPNAQLVYFIPRKARKRHREESASDYERVPLIVTATPSYRGLAFIATNYAGADLVAAEVVYADDDFRYLGPIREPVHEPTLDNTRRNEASCIGSYSVAVMKNGNVRAEYVDAPTIIRIRQMSEFPNGLMWTKLWTEGWRKVPIRRLCKTVMVSNPQMGAAIETLNKNEGLVLERTEAPLAARQSGMVGLSAAMDRTDESDVPVDVIRLSNPVDSTDPPGSIEWWLNQIHAADSLERMDDIKVAALSDMVDQTEDADIFRDHYADRCKNIRGENHGS